MDDDTARLPRSFTWLNVTQFLGALNDNVFRFLVIFFLVVGLGREAERTTVMAIAWVAFVLPFLLFSHAAGVIADRASKRSVIVFAKALEVAVMVLGCVAIAARSDTALYGLIFLMSTQSAIFGPSKYGIIPELVRTEKLSQANSLLVGISYLAIIIGTFIPSYFLLEVLDYNFGGVGVFCVVVSLVGLLACLRIERTPAAATGKTFSPWFLLEIFRTLRSLRRDRHLFLAVLGPAYFLYLGAFLQQNLLIYGSDHLFLGWIESGYLFPIAAFGIGLGAVLAGRLSGRNIEFGVVPIGAVGLTLCTLLLAVMQPDFDRVLIIMFFVGLSAGLFIVPLNAFIQYRSPRGRLGEILACGNFLSFLGVALAAGSMLFLERVLSLSSRQCFGVIGCLTGLLAIAAVIVLPDFLVRFVVVVVTRLVYRIRLKGVANVPLAGGALLVSNHATWVDALLLSATQQRRIRFVMAREIYANRWCNPIFRLMGVIPVSPDDPPRQVLAALGEARQALDDGFLVCIFAEGALTRNGNMRGFRPGMERILKGSQHPVIPTCIGGAWGSIFSYYGGRLLTKWPRQLPYPVSILFGTPMPSTSTTSDVRAAVQELSAGSADLWKSRDRVLARRLVQTVRRSWFRTALCDTTGKRLSFGRTLAGSLALARELARVMGPDESRAGILMPACVGGALINLALALRGKVAVNLNFTASTSSVRSAIEQCGIRTVISSRAFMEKLDSLECPAGTVYIEDIGERIGGVQKLVALAAALLLPTRLLLRHANVEPDDVVTVIFSSGSTAEPKGIMLSHHNVLSNLEAFRDVIAFTHRDRMCAVLPLFHSFGYTCTLWAPLIIGFQVHYHPNPIDGAAIAGMVRDEALTILLATPTFLLAYLRRAKREDFASLRVAMVGAEKLKQRVADAFEERFGLRPLEGYGTTELSPVASVNVPNVELGGVSQVGTKVDSIGHPLPGVAMRIVEPDTGAPIETGGQGMLLVKGPNVMRGYLGKPEKTAEVIRGGWYETGDIARMDEDGFVFLVDRLSRFSKIGGEMVPHLAIEESIQQAMGAVSQVVVVTSAPDEKKGEQLVLFYTAEAGDADGLLAVVKSLDMPNLWKPRKENFVNLESLPTLGSGKLDLKRLKEIARDFTEQRPGAFQRTVDKIRKTL